MVNKKTEQQMSKMADLAQNGAIWPIWRAYFYADLLTMHFSPYSSELKLSIGGMINV